MGHVKSVTGTSRKIRKIHFFQDHARITHSGYTLFGRSLLPLRGPRDLQLISRPRAAGGIQPRTFLGHASIQTKLSKMEFAFLAATPLSARTHTLSPVCPTPAPPPSVAQTITMRCRRDLKKEKQLRNLEFARAHRKRVVRRYNRRAAQEAVQNEDNEYLSSIYGTIRFGSNAGSE